MFFFGCPLVYYDIGSVILIDMSLRSRESAIIELVGIGFTRYEASLYVAIVALGPSTYDELIDESDVPYGRFYVVAGTLVNKGLVEILPGRPNVYQCISPNHAIGKYLNESKERILRALETEKILPAI